MSIESEITRLQGAKADIKTAIEAKGVTVPSNALLDTYDDYIAQISGGSSDDYFAPQTTATNATPLTTLLKYPAVSTPNVTQFSFSGCYAIESIDTSGFANALLNNMYNMFSSCEKLEEIDLSNFTTTNVTSISSMFYGCKKLKSVDMSTFSFGNVTTMNGVFNGCNEIETIVFPSSINDNKNTSMENMFQNCYALKNVNLEDFNGTICTSMRNMFYECHEIVNVDMSGIGQTTCNQTRQMFRSCPKLKTVDLSSFSNSASVNVQYMFANCDSLERVDLRSFNFASTTNLSSMFGGQGVVPANCLVIVADNTQKSTLSNAISWLTNIKTVAEL